MTSSLVGSEMCIRDRVSPYIWCFVCKSPFLVPVRSGFLFVWPGVFSGVVDIGWGHGALRGGGMGKLKGAVGACGA
eukprot:4480413-Prorocentrum_lima.AAC.1